MGTITLPKVQVTIAVNALNLQKGTYVMQVR